MGRRIPTHYGPECGPTLCRKTGILLVTTAFRENVTCGRCKRVLREQEEAKRG